MSTFRLKQNWNRLKAAGYTLIELLTTVAIIGVIARAVPIALNFSVNAKVTEGIDQWVPSTYLQGSVDDWSSW